MSLHLVDELSSMNIEKKVINDVITHVIADSAVEQLGRLGHDNLDKRVLFSRIDNILDKFSFDEMNVLIDVRGDNFNVDVFDESLTNYDEKIINEIVRIEA